MQGTEYLEQNKFKISAKNSGYFLLIQQKKECKRTPFICFKQFVIIESVF